MSEEDDDNGGLEAIFAELRLERAATRRYWLDPTARHRDTCVMEPVIPETWGDPGEIRRCPHGVVQLAMPTPPGSPVAGGGTGWWKDLHPFWNPFRYKRAVAALDQ